MILARGNRACAAGTPGVGHTPPEEAPQLVTEMLLKFLARDAPANGRFMEFYAARLNGRWWPISDRRLQPTADGPLVTRGRLSRPSTRGKAMVSKVTATTADYSQPRRSHLPVTTKIFSTVRVPRTYRIPPRC